MLDSKKKWAWQKVILMIALFLVIAVGLPSSYSKAETEDKQRALLNKTITYCATMDSPKYTQETWEVFQAELKKAQAVYEKVSEESNVYRTARDELEKVKANLAFKTSTDKGNPLPYRTLTSDQIVDEMGAGWNLGNTMEGHTGFAPSETLWQSVTTTKKLIQTVHDLGFNTVRIPVTWGTMIDDDNGYSINEKWISRVQDIVDYCISQDMYVIINIHHDGAEQLGWLSIAAEDIDPVYEKFEAVWRNIAERFKDYDEHLIFESMNEITGDGKTTTDIQDTRVIMNLNQIFVNVVRSTGSNNSVRWLSVPGRYTNIAKTTSKEIGFDIPADTVTNRIFVSVHQYDYPFGLLETMGVTKFTYSGVTDLANMCQMLLERFTSKGIPVILGEYGAVNKKNTAERAYYYEAFTRICQLDGVVACVWDQGWYDLSKNPDYSFSLIDRSTCQSVYPKIINAIMRGTYLPAVAKDYTDIIKNPKITKIMGLKLSNSTLAMVLGDSKKVTAKVAPSKTNDVVLWKTSDASIATVSNGHIRARGIGTVTITAFSQSGSISKTIKVTVKAKASAKPCTAIITEKDSYKLTEGEAVFLDISLTPADTDDYVTYKSSDETVATVSPLGKAVGCSEGTANITITASSGFIKTVKVNVKKAETRKELSLALNVYYNDSATGYFSNETGKAIMISGNGQYTLTFDCEKDLSDAAKLKGVTSLTNLTAVYIKDNAVTLNQAAASPLSSCYIQYDKVVVDGVELTVTQKEAKNALKPSGVFDTNDPLNSWDGSSVKEVTVTNHVLNLVGFKNPKKITVTFTLSKLKFK